MKQKRRTLKEDVAQKSCWILWSLLGLNNSLLITSETSQERLSRVLGEPSNTWPPKKLQEHFSAVQQLLNTSLTYKTFFPKGFFTLISLRVARCLTVYVEFWTQIANYTNVIRVIFGKKQLSLIGLNVRRNISHKYLNHCHNFGDWDKTLQGLKKGPRFVICTEAN